MSVARQNLGVGQRFSSCRTTPPALYGQPSRPVELAGIPRLVGRHTERRRRTRNPAEPTRHTVRRIQHPRRRPDPAPIDDRLPVRIDCHAQPTARTRDRVHQISTRINARRLRPRLAIERDLIPGGVDRGTKRRRRTRHRDPAHPSLGSRRRGKPSTCPTATETHSSPRPPCRTTSSDTTPTSPTTPTSESTHPSTTRDPSARHLQTMMRQKQAPQGSSRRQTSNNNCHAREKSPPNHDTDTSPRSDDQLRGCRPVQSDRQPASGTQRAYTRRSLATS